MNPLIPPAMGRNIPPKSFYKFDIKLPIKVGMPNKPNSKRLHDSDSYRGS